MAGQGGGLVELLVGETSGDAWSEVLTALVSQAPFLAPSRSSTIVVGGPSEGARRLAPPTDLDGLTAAVRDLGTRSQQGLLPSSPGVGGVPDGRHWATDAGALDMCRDRGLQFLHRPWRCLDAQLREVH